MPVNLPAPAKAAMALALLAAGGIGYALFRRPAPPPPPPPASYAQAAQSLSQFNGQLAQVALDQLGHIPGLGIRATDAQVPIGTLFVPGRSLDLDEDSCRPDAAPAAYAASAFPDFTVQNGVAASVGFSPAVASLLTDAGAQIARDNAVTIHFDLVKREYLDDHKLAELLRKPDCLAALSEGPVSMIRGYFLGKRSFTLSASQTGKVGATLAKVSNFNLSRGAGNSSITLQDPEDFGFLQLYTQVAAATLAPPPRPVTAVPDPREEQGPHADRHHHHKLTRPIDTSAPAPPPPAPVTVARTVAAAPIAGQGRVYLQRDQLDKSNAVAAVAAALSRAGFPVVAKVETVVTTKMPRLAQVRYFNATDIAAANKALAILRLSFPSAILERIPLPSPDGQLEIWLPKV